MRQKLKLDAQVAEAMERAAELKTMFDKASVRSSGACARGVGLGGVAAAMFLASSQPVLCLADSLGHYARTPLLPAVPPLVALVSIWQGALLPPVFLPVGKASS